MPSSSVRCLCIYTPALCPFSAAAVEISDPDHPARIRARDYKNAFAERLIDCAREAGATDPEQLGEQLALLLDGASARNRVLNADTVATAAAIAGFSSRTQFLRGNTAIPARKHGSLGRATPVARRVGH